MTTIGTPEDGARSAVYAAAYELTRYEATGESNYFTGTMNTHQFLDENLTAECEEARTYISGDMVRGQIWKAQAAVKAELSR